MPRARAEAELSRMVKAIRHESFYQTGTWINESMGVYVGWAVKKDSFCDGLPIRNEHGDITLIFSGEEYSSPDSIRRLKESGHSFETEGPSYLVHSYEQDQSFPANLNGMFQGLLIDQTKGTDRKSVV